MIYAYAALQEGVPYANGAPSLAVDVPALVDLADDRGILPVAGKDFKAGQTLIRRSSPGLEGQDAWPLRVVLDEYPR